MSTSCGRQCSNTCSRILISDLPRVGVDSVCICLEGDKSFVCINCITFMCGVVSCVWDGFGLDGVACVVGVVSSLIVVGGSIFISLASLSVFCFFVGDDGVGIAVSAIGCDLSG